MPGITKPGGRKRYVKITDAHGNWIHVHLGRVGDNASKRATRYVKELAKAVYTGDNVSEETLRWLDDCERGVLMQLERYGLVRLLR